MCISVAKCVILKELSGVILNLLVFDQEMHLNLDLSKKVVLVLYNLWISLESRLYCHDIHMYLIGIKNA